MAGLVGTAIVASAVWWLDDAAGGPTARLAGALQLTAGNAAAPNRAYEPDSH
jgi:hypothetical protein